VTDSLGREEQIGFNIDLTRSWCRATRVKCVENGRESISAQQTTEAHSTRKQIIQRQSNDVQKSELIAGSLSSLGHQNDYMRVIFGI
jgi:hypothetical protein